jgi:hypothetical protein
MQSKAYPHHEERPTGASRRTQDRAALVPILAQPPRRDLPRREGGRVLSELAISSSCYPETDKLT